MSSSFGQEAGRSDGLAQWVSQLWRKARGQVRTAWRPEAVWLGPGAQALRRPAETAGTGDGAMAMPDLTDMLSAWHAWCAANPGARCELALSGHFFLTLVGTDSGREAQDRIDAAREVWAQATGLSPVQLVDGLLWRALPGDGPSLVCGLPRRVLDELLDMASRHGVRIERLVPWWVAPAQSWSDTVIAAPGGAVTWVASEPGMRTVWQWQVGTDTKPPAWSVWSERQDVCADGLGHEPGIDLLQRMGVDADTCLISGRLPPFAAGDAP